MASLSDIVVVVCHGGFLTPEPYIPFIEVLRTKGIETSCPQLPTSDLARLNVGDVNNPDFNREPPEGGYPQGKNDVQVVLDVLRPLINNEGKRALIIGHSAGGWVATEASHPELQEKVRKAQGLRGGIIGIFYIGAFLVPFGESINSMTRPRDGISFKPPWLQHYNHGATGLSTLVDPIKYLFNDLEESEAYRWAASLTAGPTFDTRLTNDACAVLPCAYLVLDEDAIVPKTYQEEMISSQIQKSRDFTVYHCHTGHFPFLSWTGGLVSMVQDFIRRIEG
ncbi:Alpha/beta hydrolase fold-1 [Hypoxylon fuscum]|nr:Alpha/beta hydrolase fold-1 [Hypoxylon fuscum]